MGKYVQRYLVEGGGDITSIIVLILFFITFSILLYAVFSKPKDFYKKESRLPLDLEDENKKEQL
ncbi:MAG: CcoQ/FixQ family Cbb3-type cytochrome c oxidase assembly chaperone [Flavobacteriales bacterium]